MCCRVSLALLLLSVTTVRGAYYKARAGVGCDDFQAKNLGTKFKNAQECGEAALRDRKCTSTEIMYSKYSYSWGCRCCARKPRGMTDEEAYTPNVNWDVWDYYPLSIPPFWCDPGKMELEVKVKTDSFPLETTWTLVNECDAEAETIKGPKYNEPHHQYTHKHCVDPGQYRFTISDWFGDGVSDWYGDGSYSIKYDKETVARGGDFNYNETVTFGTPCEETFLRLPGYGCDKFQAANLGNTFKNPEECANEARMEPACTGNEIMWSPYSYDWGCRCCRPKPKGDDKKVYSKNSNWHIYQFRDDD